MTGPVKVLAGVLAGLAIAVVVATQFVSIVFVKLPDAQRTLVVAKPEGMELRFLDSPDAVCARMSKSAPARTTFLGPGFCRFDVTARLVASDNKVYARLPFVDALHRWTLPN